jgi:hypothetical protein
MWRASQCYSKYRTAAEFLTRALSEQVRVRNVFNDSRNIVTLMRPFSTPPTCGPLPKTLTRSFLRLTILYIKS